MLPTTTKKRAVVHRMVIGPNVCPSGLKTKFILERSGFEVDDRPLVTREAVDAFKREHAVMTTPQTFVEGARIGGYEDVRRFLGKRVRDGATTTYVPVMAIFAMAALVSVAMLWPALSVAAVIERFLGLTTCILAMQKLQNIEGFSTTLLTYDVLARRVPAYAYVYPFAEAFVGLAMLSHVGRGVAAAIALLLGLTGAGSIWLAVYVQKRTLRCACVGGGGAGVPLGAVSLLENLVMTAMGFAMVVALAG